MLTHPTLEKLQQLKFTGMVTALSEQINTTDIDQLTFEERLGLLVDREITERENRKLSSRMRRAKLRFPQAAMEDIDYRTPRGIDRSMMQSMADCRWIKDRLNILITGPTGVGKSWLACALGQKGCREGYSVLYTRLPRLMQELVMAKADGRFAKVLTQLAKIDLLILDDWGLSKLTAEQRRDLLEILEDRHEQRSTIVTSQLPIEKWHGMIGDPTLADAILDRLIHNAHKLPLKGESMRKQRSKLTEPQHSE